MSTVTLAKAMLAGLAAAITLAPAATATGVDCEDSGTASLCQRPGHASIYAEPPEHGLYQYAIGPRTASGAGPLPPVMAMD